MKKRPFQLAIAGLVLATSGIVLAQESEFQAKIQEDLDSYRKQIIENCTTTEKLTLRYDGKLGSNPRESEKPEWNAVTTLCTSALDALSSTCQGNGVVRKAMSKLDKVTCTKGKGTIGYALKGSQITFTVDPSYTKTNPAGQESDLVDRMKKDLDK